MRTLHHLLNRDSLGQCHWCSDGVPFVLGHSDFATLRIIVFVDARQDAVRELCVLLSLLLVPHPFLVQHGSDPSLLLELSLSQVVLRIVVARNRVIPSFLQTFLVTMEVRKKHVV